MRLLSRLLDLVFPVRSDEEILRETSIDAFLTHLSPRTVTYTTPPTIALLPFHTKEVRAALHEAKYHGSRKAFEHLGRALTDYLADLDLLESRETVLVPLPLGRARLRERGFNQVEEVLRLTAFPMERLLVRTRETRSQISLSRGERRKNMCGAFEAAESLDPRRQYILVDDVITTGATLQAALDALTSAGAVHILPIALAH